MVPISAKRLSKRAIVIVALIGVSLWGGESALSRWVATSAYGVTDQSAEQLAESNGRLLQSELQKFRLLPLVLAEYPDVSDVLLGQSASAGSRINPKLELLAQRTDAAVIYLIDANGVTVAASNFRQPSSFVGQNYGFRPYYAGAMKSGSAELFAVGTVSGIPGLYIAQRIGDANAPLGVVVVKIEFDDLQANWSGQPGITMVTDHDGIVIISSKPEWRFRSLGALDEATKQAIREARQYSDMSLEKLDFIETDHKVLLPGGDQDGYRHATRTGAIAGSRIHTYFPIGPALAAANTRARLLAGGVSVVLLAAMVFLWRLFERRELERSLRLALEREVERRTLELRETNGKLVQESRERRLADQRYRKAREELAQASRLGSIGQITAGVAHEINQPVAAIRAFAENGRTFLAQRDEEKAAGNFSRIVELTQRIGRITSELRDFARKRTPKIAKVNLSEAIDSALLLTSMNASSVQFEREDEALDRMVWADRIRLEQVFINLIQNALQALDGRPSPLIQITGTVAGDRILVDVCDNGPGLAPELAEQLFVPFVTGRKDGLGLGLAISRSIMREFGGELSLSPWKEQGANFRIELRLA